MQGRHTDRYLYFNELANTSRAFYIDYVNRYHPLEATCRILEIGCGDGGNLLPFAEAGCRVTGIDRSEERISDAIDFFKPLGYHVTFMATDFFDFKPSREEETYDVVLVHDVIEHIARKAAFVEHLKQFVSLGGMVFWRFPAWQMPFGGHQQICRSRCCSRLPFIHLLPERLHRKLLTRFKESPACIEELIEIKRCGVSVEKFEQLLKASNCLVIDRTLWFINPHYKQKFNLTPRKLPPPAITLQHILDTRDRIH